MNTRTLVENARKLHQKALSTITAEIASIEARLVELKEARRSLTMRDIMTADVAPSRARKKMTSTTTSKAGRKPVGRPSTRGASKPTTKIAPSKSDKIFAKLQSKFTLEDLRKAGGAPISLAHWTRAGRIMKLADGSFKKTASGLRSQVTPPQQTKKTNGGAKQATAPQTAQAAA